jgi:tRNA (guanosine-2'-O-)-methyltransferase
VPLRDPARSVVDTPDARLTPQVVLRCLAPALSARRRRRIDAVVARRLASVTVLLEGIHDPRNGAAVVRSCEALGLLQIHVVFGAEEGCFPVSRRVTQAADKWVDIFVHESTPAALAFLQRSGYHCWAALPPPLHGRRGQPCAVAVDHPVALVFGNEHGGLSAAARALCARRFHLPMFGFTESLNVSVAVALSLQDVVARRRSLLGRHGDLPDGAAEQLRAAYYARSVRHAPEVLLRGLARAISPEDAGR